MYHAMGVTLSSKTTQLLLRGPTFEVWNWLARAERLAQESSNITLDLVQNYPKSIMIFLNLRKFVNIISSSIVFFLSDYLSFHFHHLHYDLTFLLKIYQIFLYSKHLTVYSLNSCSPKLGYFALKWKHCRHGLFWNVDVLPH